MKKIALILCGIILAGQSIYANSIGVGYTTRTSIYKSDRENSFLPMVDFKYDNFFIKGATVNGMSIGYNVYEDDFYTLSLYVKPFGGYKISSGDMDYGYKSIDSRHRKIMGGAEFKVYTGIYETELSTSVDYGKKGGNILVQLTRPYFVNSDLVVIPSVNFAYFNSEYIDYYFGVNKDETGGSIKNYYDGKAGYTFGVNLTGRYRVTDSFSVLGFVGVNKLSSEIENSPIVDDDVMYFAGTGIVYTF